VLFSQLRSLDPRCDDIIAARLYREICENGGESVCCLPVLHHELCVCGLNAWLCVCLAVSHRSKQFRTCSIALSRVGDSNMQNVTFGGMELVEEIRVLLAQSRNGHMPPIQKSLGSFTATRGNP
jgi:hypothetical protein